MIVLEELSHLVSDEFRRLFHVGIEPRDSLSRFENGCLLVSHECLVALQSCRLGTKPNLIDSFTAVASSSWVICFLLGTLLVALLLVGAATFAPLRILVGFEQEEFIFFEK